MVGFWIVKTNRLRGNVPVYEECGPVHISHIFMVKLSLLLAIMGLTGILMGKGV